MLKADPPPLLIDVLGGSGSHRSLPGAHRLPGGGSSRSDDPGDRLAALTGGGRDRALVFFCRGWECWLSYKAALKTAALGYTRVSWYRGGAKSRKAAGLPTNWPSRSL